MVDVGRRHGTAYTKSQNRLCSRGSPQLSPPFTKLDGVTYKVADCRAEREAAFRLVYQAYEQTGLMNSNTSGMRVTPFHLLATTDVFVAIYRREVVCTLSLMRDGELGVPMESIYEDEIRNLRESGGRFGEVSCLADKRRGVSDFMPVFVNLSALVMQFARHNGVDQLLIVVHPRHEKFYGRLFGFERLGAPKSYPWVCDNPAVACGHDFGRLDRQRYALYDRIYGVDYAVHQLLPRPMPTVDQDYFGPAAALNNSFIPVAA